MRRSILFFSQLTICLNIVAQASLKEYLDVHFTSKEPKVFEALSTENIEYGGSLSFLTSEIYFTSAGSNFEYRHIMSSSFKDGKFAQPQTVSFDGELFDDASDVQINGNGDLLIFKARGHLEDTSRHDSNIWISHRKNSEWSKAKLLNESINHNSLSEFYPILTKNSIYFSREIPETSYDIYRSQKSGANYEKAVRLPDHINTPLVESDAYISPDESFMIFVRMYSEDGLGVSDLYISFNNMGVWSQPQNMTDYNSRGVDGSPFVTPDGKHLIFTSNRRSPDPEAFDGHLDLYIARFDINDWN